MKFNLLYAFLILGDLFAVSQRTTADTPLLEYIFKPALLLSLAIYFWQNSKQTTQNSQLDTHNSKLTTQNSEILRGSKKRNFILAALGFSWLGDVLLLFDGYFIFGLGAFLVAHVFYILVFTQDNPLRFGAKTPTILPNLLVAVYGIGFILYLFPHLSEGMRVPVLAYACTIMVMLLAAVNRMSVVSKSSGQLVLLGAILFVLSDSMIAVSKFVAPFPLSGFGVMLTYAVGQFLIVRGLLDSKLT